MDIYLIRIAVVGILVSLLNQILSNQTEMNWPFNKLGGLDFSSFLDYSIYY